MTFLSDQAGASLDPWTKRADGSAQEVLQLDQERRLMESLWSPDGERLIFRTSTLEVGGGDILTLRPGADTVPVPLVASDFAAQGPTLSPDGRWMAYQSDSTGRFEIYVVPFPNAATAKFLVSADGGTEPLWSRGGREIFYRNAEGDMVSVRVETAPTFSAGATSVLFSATEYLTNVNHRQYDVTPDGERFIMVRPVGDCAQGALIVVENFFEELKARVGGS